VVEAETVVAGALGCPGGGRAAAAGRRVGGLIAASGSLAKVVSHLSTVGRRLPLQSLATPHPT
jgi:hypothetical protein